MKTYTIKLMAQKEGKAPARLGIVEVTAASDKDALEDACEDFRNTYRNHPFIDHSKPMPKLWTELA